MNNGEPTERHPMRPTRRPAPGVRLRLKKAESKGGGKLRSHPASATTPTDPARGPGLQAGPRLWALGLAGVSSHPSHAAGVGAMRGTLLARL